MASNDFYNRKLKPNARRLRNDSTPSEIRLWCELLRNGTMMGYKFRRQRPVLNYIADFMCFELKLIIEADGISHDNEEGCNRDIKRDKALTEAGFYILRFQDEEIMDHLESVHRAIVGWIEESASARGI